VAFRKNNDSYSGDKIPINNSFGKLERLNLWWETAGKAKIQGLLDEYYNSLENIYTELYAHLSKEEQVEINILLKIIENLSDTPVTAGFEQQKVFNRRKGSNLCDQLGRKLSSLSAKYKLEWFDISAWSKQQRMDEPVMRG